MRLSDAFEESDESQEDEGPRMVLMCGIGPKHVRLLCEGDWNGGHGYTPEEVGNMTLDELFLLLCDKDILRSNGRMRTKSMSSSEATELTKDGFVRGRAADGRPIKGTVGGQSLASRLAAEQAAEKARAKPKTRRQLRIEARDAARAKEASNPQ